MKIIAMIPARMGSQRLKQKNLQDLNGIPLISHAIQKAKAVEDFAEVWVNSEHDAFEKIAKDEGVFFHKRPEELSSNTATSEQFVYEFLTKHECDFVVQLHSIAPLLNEEDVLGFVNEIKKNQYDVLLSTEDIQIECVYQNKPINFTFDEKTNSQELTPVKRISWSISAWRKSAYINAFENQQCATYSGKVGYYTVNHLAGHVIKTQNDLDFAESWLKIKNK